MRPRERIEKLLDPGTPFLELSSLAANMAYGGESPSASSIVGIGVVSGREVMIRADDPTVKGGAWYPLTAKKIVRALDIAMENRLPVVHLCDSAGGFLPLQSEIFPGQVHGRPDLPQPVDPVEARRQAARAGVRPLHGRRRLHPGLSDYNVIVRGTGAVFLGGPPLVQGGDRRGRHASRSSAAPTCTPASPAPATIPAASEDEAIHIGREIVAQWDRPKKWDCQREAPEDPAYDPQEIYGILPDDIKKQFDMREIIARIVDGSRFHEYQPNYGTTLDLRLRQYLGLQGRHPRQQWRAVQRFLAEGRAFHRAVQPEQHAAGLPAEHHRLHDRPRIRAQAASPRTGPR